MECCKNYEDAIDLDHFECVLSIYEHSKCLPEYWTTEYAAVSGNLETLKSLVRIGTCVGGNILNFSAQAGQKDACLWIANNLGYVGPDGAEEELRDWCLTLWPDCDWPSVSEDGEDM